MVARAASATLYSMTADGPWKSAYGGVKLAQSFTTGSSPGNLTKVDFRFRNANDGNSSSTSGTYNLALFSESSGNPGSELAPIATNVPMVAWSDGFPSFTVSHPLTASTTYFIVAWGTGTFGWKYNPTTAPTTSVSPAPTFVQRQFDGSSWSALSLPGNFSLVVEIDEQPTVPGAPTSVTGSAGDGQVSLSWSAPASNGGSPITGYTATASPGGATCSVATTSCVVSGLTNGTSYTFTVKATNAVGDSVASSASAAVTPLAPPPQPPPAPDPAPVPEPSASSALTPTPTPTASPSVEPTPTPSATPTVASSPTSSPTRTRSPRPLPTATSADEQVIESTEVIEEGATAAEVLEEGVIEEELVEELAADSPSPSPTVTETTEEEAEATTPEPQSENNAAPQAIFDAQPPPGVSLFSDNAPVGPIVDLVVDLQIGASVEGSAAIVQAAGLLPGSVVEILMFSERRVIGTGIADAAGNASVITTMPGDLPPGQHTIMALGTGPSGQPVQSVGAFELSAEGNVEAFVEPGQTATPIAPGDKQLERALAAGKPVYDISRFPATTAAVAVAAASVVGLAGAGGLTKNSPGGSSSGEGSKSSRGKLAGVVTKKLKALKADAPGRGDLSRTWRMPGTRRTDEWIKELPKRAGKVSALLPRVLVDGAWSRAMFGSFGFVLWGIGLVLGLWSAWSTGFQALPPALPLMLAIIALGILDAAAGAISWATITTAALVTGNLTTWAEFRTVLGLFVIFASIPLLAHVIRPLRRRVGDSAMDRFDRVADYVMPPIFLAFAAASMFKALNGLSGLELVSSDDFGEVRVVVIVAFLIRMAMEDVATYAYPVRSAEVQPEKLTSPGKGLSLLSVAIRVGLFLVIAEPFFGLTWATYLSALLVAIPMVLKVYEDDLPNLVWLNKWYPRGVAQFLMLLVVGIYLSFWLLGQDATDEQVRQTYNFILLPGVISGLITLVGREGGVWPENWWKRVLGLGVWLFAVGIVTGFIALT